jgi:hypothetical protein
VRSLRLQVLNLLTYLVVEVVIPTAEAKTTGIMIILITTWLHILQVIGIDLEYLVIFFFSPIYCFSLVLASRLIA